MDRGKVDGRGSLGRVNGNVNGGGKRGPTRKTCGLCSLGGWKGGRNSRMRECCQQTKV